MPAANLHKHKLDLDARGQLEKIKIQIMGNSCNTGMVSVNEFASL